MLSKYYIKASSEFYTLSVLLDPRLKMQYLQKVEFDTMYPETVSAAKKYLIKLMDSSGYETTPNDSKDTSNDYAMHSILRSAFIEDKSILNSEEELNSYLQENAEPYKMDPSRLMEGQCSQIPQTIYRLQKHSFDSRF